MNTLTSIVYTVRDLDSAKAIHAALLGAEPHTDQPYYVGFNVGGVEIGLAPQSQPEPAATPVVYIGVADLDAAVAAVVQAGATLVAGPQDVGGGTRIATVTDANGNTLGLIHHA
jgi:predicted enzyme related to lactoylglutathione lyase